MVETPRSAREGTRMSEHCTTPVLHQTVEEVVGFARLMADEVHDPCSRMAVELKIGLAEMGLVRHVVVEPDPGGWKLKLRLRATPPGCQHSFGDNLEQRLDAHPGIATAEVLWDRTFDWTPEDVVPPARERIDARQRRLLQG
jgi:metal-sulfur cluster biosynthetic enzyme